MTPLPSAEQPTGVEIHTADGVFIKQMVIAKRWTVVPQHEHAWDHTSMLALGAVALWRDGKFDRTYDAPTGIFIEAGVKHTFQSLVDNTIIFCVHNLHGEHAVKILEEHQLIGEI
jgi:quercetin dioxygenase-like cupin family protein